VATEIVASAIRNGKRPPEPGVGAETLALQVSRRDEAERVA